MTAAPRLKTPPMRSMPRRRFRCRNICTEKTLPFIDAHGQETVALQSSNRRQGHRRIPDGDFAHHRQADLRGADKGTRPAGRRHRRLERAYSRQEVRDLRRSGSMPWPCRLPAGTGRRADACAGHQRRQGMAREGRAAARQLSLRHRTATSMPARISGTCARCCSPSRSTS